MTSTPAIPTRTMLRAEGFTCPSCVTRIEKALTRLPGVSSATVHFASSRIEVEHDRRLTDVPELVAEVGRVGYTARPAAF